MAKSERRQPQHRPKTTSEPAPTDAKAQEPAPAEELQPPEPAPRPRRGGRPRNDDPKPAGLSIWQRIAAVPAADWGTRIYLYLYLLEPVCDLTRSRNKKYLCRYEGPINDEQSIMVEYGSGRYRLVLSNNKPTTMETGGIYEEEFEIVNPKYPPRTPRALWLDDPRNRRWAALLPPDQPPAPPAAPAPAFDAIAALDTLSQIQDRVADRLEQRQPAPAAAAPSAADSLTQGLAMVEKIMSMKADNPMVDVMKDEMKSMREEMRAEREENRKLQAEIRQAANAKPAEKSGMDVLRETIKTMKEELLPSVKELLPQITEGATRSRMGSWQEFFVAMAPTVKDLVTPIFNRYAMGGMGDITPQLNPGTPPGAHQPPNQAPRPELEFLKAYAPAMLSYLADGETGGEFADYIYTGCGPEWNGVKWLILKQTTGAANLVELFKRSPYAARIEAVIGEPTDTPAAKEAAFRLFLEQFVAWQPEPEGAGDDGVIDLSKAEEETV